MSRAGNGCVVTGRGMDDATVQMQHCMNIATTDENGTDVASMVVAPIENHAETPGFTPNVHFTRLGERELYTAIVLPSSDSEYAHEAILPVLMKPYGGPGFQQVIESQSFYWDAQWWADQGYIVVTTDGRGTTGRGPQWDRAIYETMKSVTLEDQIDAVRALPEALEALAGENAAVNVPQPDLSRVAMIGWSYGGFLSALAVLEAPERSPRPARARLRPTGRCTTRITPNAISALTRPCTNATASSPTRRSLIARSCSSTGSPTTM